MDSKLVKKTKIINCMILLVVILLLSLPIIYAHPTLPTEFYGSAQFFNNPVTLNTPITAYDPEGNLCGKYTVQNIGYYGTLSCKGKDSSGLGNGPDENDKILFKIGTYIASTLNDTTRPVTPINITWHESEFKEVHLVVPPLVCGDGYCDNYEACDLCIEDCGVCPYGAGTGGGTGGTGSGSAGGGSAGGGASITSTQAALPSRGSLQNEEVCEEAWLCLEWSVCYPNSTRNRECSDVNKCGTNESIPELSEACIFQGEPKPRNETPIQPITKPQTQLPKLVEACTTKLDIFSLPSLLFIMLFLIIIAVSLGRLHSKTEKIKKDKELTEIQKLEREFHTKKETYIFITIISCFSVIVYIYHYFFFMCKDKYIQYLWLLAVLISLSPVVINFIIELMKYSEAEKYAKLSLLNDTHYQHFKKLVRITDQHLLEIDTKLVLIIDKLDQSDDFNALMTNLPELKVIYKDMNKLYQLYKLRKSSRKLEKELVDNINNLAQEDAYKNAITTNPEIKELQTNLGILIKTYQTKQELYDEIEKLEKDYDEQMGLYSKNLEESNPSKPKNTSSDQDKVKDSFKESISAQDEQNWAKDPQGRA